jgi:hypothetical protein
MGRAGRAIRKPNPARAPDWLEPFVDIFPIIGYRLFAKRAYAYRLAERSSNPARDTSRGGKVSGAPRFSLPPYSRSALPCVILCPEEMK